MSEGAEQSWGLGWRGAPVWLAGAVVVALVGSVAASYLGVLRARRSVIQGQGDALLRALMRSMGRPPGIDGVRLFFEQYRADGVRYAAATTPWGLLEAGGRAGPAPVHLPPGEMRISRVAGRVRIEQMLPPPDPPGKGPGKGRHKKGFGPLGFGKHRGSPWKHGPPGGGGRPGFGPRSPRPEWGRKSPNIAPPNKGTWARPGGKGRPPPMGFGGHKAPGAPWGGPMGGPSEAPLDAAAAIFPASDGGTVAETLGDLLRAARAGKSPLFPLPPMIIIEFEPSLADGLTRTAAISLILGLAAAGLFMALGLALRRAAAKERTLLMQAEQARRLAAIGEMSAVLAHEIRNPLTSLKGHALLLQEALPEGKPQDKATRVIKEAERLEALTTDLLGFVRSGTLQRRSVDPVQLVLTAMGAVGVESFSLEANEAPPSWSLDPDRFRQALENILKNAAQAVADIEGAPPARVLVRQHGDTLMYEVRDYGPGISPGQEATIFEAFHTNRTRGTGLGLAVAQRVVHQHGGVIDAANHPEGGAVFTIRVPKSEEVADGDDSGR